MSQDLVALVTGAVLAVVAVAYVLHPLFAPPAMESSRPPEPAVTDDAIEARVRELRSRHVSCERCGVRPEPDAVYCSNCGRRVRPPG
jgi:hypothetical protein